MTTPPMHVLVADDDVAPRGLVRELLEPRGHTVEEVETGQEALDVLSTRDFDVVLMDVMMPDMDGAEATRRFRAAEGEEERTPVLAFTAGGPSAEPEICLDAGMDAFLRKPINPWILIETVERFGLGKGDPPPPGTAVPQSLLRLADGDPQHLAGMAKVFLEFAPIQLEALREALEEKDALGLARTARQLRGGARVFRADGILIPAERLEFLGARGVVEGTESLVKLIEREVSILETILTRAMEGIGRGTPGADA